MTEEREMTAPMTSVGTEVGQSPNVTTDIIPDYGENEQEMQAQTKE